ncbi:hypothetical protein [Massilia phosphatilytica]
MGGTVLEQGTVGAEVGQFQYAAARVDEQVGRLEVEIAPAVLVDFRQRAVHQVLDHPTNSSVLTLAIRN